MRRFDRVFPKCLRPCPIACSNVAKASYARWHQLTTLAGEPHSPHDTEHAGQDPAQDLQRTATQEA